MNPRYLKSRAGVLAVLWLSSVCRATEAGEGSRGSSPRNQPLLAGSLAAPDIPSPELRLLLSALLPKRPLNANDVELIGSLLPAVTGALRADPKGRRWLTAVGRDGVLRLLAGVRAEEAPAARPVAGQVASQVATLAQRTLPLANALGTSGFRHGAASTAEAESRLLSQAFDGLGSRHAVPVIAGTNADRHADTLQGALTEGFLQGGLRLSSPPDLPRISGAALVNDVSKLHPTVVYGIVRPETVTEVVGALSYARRRGLKVSIAGARHSMGGQAMQAGSLHLDMTALDAMSLDERGGLLTVEAGASWQKIQQLLDAHGFSVDVMQTPNVFTVGGSLSVNAHGSNPNAGPLASTVESFRLLKADGAIVTCSRSENPELFQLALGGYGLFGIILDAQLRVRRNELYSLRMIKLDYKDFPDFFQRHVEGNNKLGLTHSLLSVAPASLLREVLVMTYQKVDHPGPTLPPLQGKVRGSIERGIVWLGLQLIQSGDFGKGVSWWITKNIVPRLPGKILTRNQAMNTPLWNSIGSKGQETQILQEYFLPREKLVPFLDDLRKMVRKHGMEIIVAAIRAVRKDDTTFLAYAKGDSFGVVLTFRHRICEESDAAMARFTGEMIDRALQHGGRFYLPYQLAYSEEQLRQAYPESAAFFAFKKRHDPSEIFSNGFYSRYVRSAAKPL